MKKKNRLCLFMVLCMLAVHCPAVHAEAQEEDKNQDVTLAPYFFIEGADPRSEERRVGKECRL